MTALASRSLALFDGPGGEPTLDDLLVSAWEGLAVHGTVICPACESQQMRPEYGAHARPIGGRCTSCGSKLS